MNLDIQTFACGAYGWFQQAVMRFCVCAAVALIAVLILRSQTVRDAAVRLAALWCEASHLARLVVIAFVTGFVLYAGTKTNSPSAGIMMPLLPPLPQAVVQTVTEDDIARGYREVAETNCEASVYAMPEGITPSFNWHKRGTFGEWSRLDLGGFAFPLGTNDETFSAFSVFNDGRIRPTPRDAAREICAVGVPMLAMQGASRFWVADVARPESAPYLSKLLTWEKFFLNADTNTPINAQIELFANGDFTTRSNSLERIYRRVTYFDWDGDGLENSVDPDPLVAGADAHGTNAEWYNVVCSNVLEAVAVDDDPPVELTWRDGVNSNAYYFVDVIATNGPAPIYFTGDRESRLGNPVVVARAFETNHVPLLIGINYAVISTVPLSVSLPHEGFATITTNGVSNYEVQWPLNFVFNESIGETNRVYSVTIEPFDPGGELTWAGTGGGMRSGTSSGDGCDCINYGFLSVWYTCSKDCTCGRTCRANGIYGLEGAAYPVDGGECRCGFDDDIGESAPEHGYAPYVSATFSCPAVIFEDDYLESPGVVKPGGSTRVRLTLYAYGGPNGGTVSFSSTNLGKLTSVGTGAYFPTSLSLAPEETFYSTGVYEGAAASASEGDVSVNGTFMESMAAPPLVSSNSLTVVQVALQTEFAARDNLCNSRHTYGVGEKVEFIVTPALSTIRLRAVKADTTDIETPYDTFGSSSFFMGVSEVDASAQRTYICPATDTTPDITVSFADAEYRPVMTIVEPSEVVSPAAFWSGDFGLNQVGFGCLSITNYIGPFHVSFQGVLISEIPCNDAIPPTGYFASANYAGHLTHTSGAGAGGLLNVGENNFWRKDEAGYNPPVENWSPGVSVWKIPIGWKRFLYVDEVPLRTAYECDYENYTNKLSRPLLIGGRTDAYTQTFRIEADGTTVIEKFGWRMTRSRWSFSGTVEKTE